MVFLQLVEVKEKTEVIPVQSTSILLGPEAVEEAVLSVEPELVDPVEIVSRAGEEGDVCRELNLREVPRLVSDRGLWRSWKIVSSATLPYPFGEKSLININHCENNGDDEKYYLKFWTHSLWSDCSGQWVVLNYRTDGTSPGELQQDIPILVHQQMTYWSIIHSHNTELNTPLDYIYKG